MASNRVLKVQILSAASLGGESSSSGFSSYASLKLLNHSGTEIKKESFKTKTSARTRNPAYTLETFTLGSAYNLSNIERLPTLHIRVQVPQTFGGATTLGHVSIPLDTIVQTTELQRFDDKPLVPPKAGSSAGSLTYTLQWSADGSSSLGGGASFGSGVDNSSFNSNDNSSSSGGAASAVSSDADAYTVDPNEIDENPEIEPNQLRIVILRARNLLAKDSSFGGVASSDPKVVIECAGKTYKTKEVKKNLNPVWNEEAFFTVADPNQSLEVTVQDVDVLQNDFLGKLTIPISKFYDKKAVRMWHELKNSRARSDGEKRGDIELLIQWIYNPSIEKVLKSSSSSMNFLSSMGSMIGLVDADDEEAPADDDEKKKPKKELSDDEKKKLEAEKEKYEEERRQLKETLLNFKIKR
jgi:hypothetical protein